MKRIHFGIALLATLLILSILSNVLMHKIPPAQAKKLNQAAVLASVGDWAAARDLSEAAKIAWDQKQVFYCALCDHEDIDRIDGLFAQIQVYAATRSAVAFSSTCAHLAQRLEALSHSHSLSPENFL